MSLRLITPFVNTNIPGAYPNVVVQSQPVGLASSGIVVIMGEADGGPGYNQVALSKQVFTPDQLALVQQEYIGGQIVDSFTALAAPSDDPNITGSANLIYIAKTNNGTSASSALPGSYGTLSDSNYGVDGNLYNYQILSVDAGVPPMLSGNTVPSFGSALDGASFSLRLNGGAVDVITLSSGSSSPVSPAEAAAGQSAASAAYTSLGARTPSSAISPVLDGQTLTPGNYNTGAASLAASGPGTLTFNGAGVYVIKTSSTLVTGAGGIATIALTGGATAANIYWVVGSAATINSGFSGTFQGNVIAETSITVSLGGTVNGSLIALNGAVTLSAATNVSAQSAPLLNYAGSFALLGASGVTNTGASVATGNVGSSPTNSIAGFPPGTIVGAAHSNIAELVTELNLLLPSGIVASAGSSMNVVLTMTAEGDPYAQGSSQSFELIDSTLGDLAALGLSAGLVLPSQLPEVELNIVRPDINVNQSIDVSAAVALEVGYQGTSGTISVSATTISTTVVGGIGANLSIPISQYTTIAELAAFIAAQPGYSAVCPANAQQLPPSVLDRVSDVGIASSGAGLLPGQIWDAAYLFAQAAATSALVFTVGADGKVGLPAPMSASLYLAGGTRGATLAVDIVNILNQIGGINCNMIVPLFSEDASLDIAAGLTDPASTYTIEAINALVKSHCIQYSTPALKKNRICLLSWLGTYASAAAEAQSLGNYRCSLTMQQVSQVNSQGVIQLFQPWYASSLAAGMQAGGFYKSICNKAANLISFTDPSGFDSGSPGDVEEALSAGLLFLSQDTGRAGYWVSDQTTYGFDTNFVYNSIQAVYDSDLIALDLAQSFFTQFVGQSLADVSASAALSFLTQKMDGYLKLKLIGSSSDAPLGFKNASITIDAPEMDVKVEIKLATAIYFIPININISQIMGTAGT
jgi:hypothetical protein